jgi:putative phage-type endonuclease
MENILQYINDIKQIQKNLYDIDNYSNDETGEELEVCDIIDILELMDEYINVNPKIISDPDFDNIFLQDMNQQFETCTIIEEIIELFHLIMFPKRSEDRTEQTEEDDKEHITKQIECLHLHTQHIQRSKEWYDFRNNLITASNAYKIFETNATRNQLIYEKCKAFTADSSIVTVTDNTKQVNVLSPLHWGQKYEPLSVLIYEKMYKTTIEDFGCIKHSMYDFLGASPDGINCDPTSDIYGRMLEIKNIVNREIDGIPKKEYWIQMQLQMEVCNLNECDFLETKFIEYENETDFKKNYEIDELNEMFIHTNTGNLKGIIMYFSGEGGVPIYIYKPLNMDEIEFETFESQKIQEMELNNITWIKNIYWKLETYSCVLVKRNHRWFQDNISEIQDIWNIIKRERVSGYTHRAPNKRIIYEEIPELTKCLIRINNGKSELV